MKVTNAVEIYEVDGEEQGGVDMPVLVVSSHWSDSNRVDLALGGKRITVIALDLSKAIENATNVRRY